MKFQHVVGSVVAVGVTATLLFFSCGKGSDSGDGNGDTATSDGKDVTKAFTLAITGAQLDMPAGDMVAGAKISLATTTVPAEISAVADASPASIAIQIAGSLADGTAVAQLPAPFSVSLDISPTAALTAVEKTNANLCVVAKGIDNTLKVWRFASLAVDEATKKVVFHSIWLGAFRALYCGDTFKDVAEVNVVPSIPHLTSPGTRGRKKPGGIGK